LRSKPVAALLVDLDIAKNHIRPHVSDDNPYSGSQFKTMRHPFVSNDLLKNSNY
jgi:hypothetical protein